MGRRVVSESPDLRTPGFVEQEGDGDVLALLFAVPCDTSGRIDRETQEEYEELADEHFQQLLPGQTLV